MNCDTGHVMLVQEVSLPPHDYSFFPAELESSARRFLGNRTDGYVSLSSGGKLAKWAKQQRKARNKQAKASKRRNRK